MSYYAKTRTGMLVFLYIMLFLTTSITVSGHEKESWFLRIAVLIMILITLSIKYKFSINEDYVEYVIFLHKIPIYLKRIEPKDINQIKFVRVGWAEKGAIIKTKKGLNIRVIRFEPKEVYTDLFDFANQTSISVSKSKDYLILER